MSSVKKRPVKAYKNIEFLTSPDARIARIMCECLEPLSRFKKYKIEDAIVFFGSSRIKSKKIAQQELNALEREMAQCKNPDNAFFGFDLCHFFSWNDPAETCRPMI